MKSRRHPWTAAGDRSSGRQWMPAKSGVIPPPATPSKGRRTATAPANLHSPISRPPTECGPSREPHSACLCDGEGRNRTARHHDFQSCALPTELPRLGRTRGAWPRRAKASDRGPEGLIALGHGPSRCSTCNRRRGGGGRAYGLGWFAGRSANPRGAAGAGGTVPRHRGGGRRRADRGGRLLWGRGRRAGGWPGRAGAARRPRRAAGRGKRLARPARSWPGSR